ncbi:MAG: hypothetical protein QXJ06_03030 [Candidatus Aenigmatarchaeota archaeon]
MKIIEQIKHRFEKAQLEKERIEFLNQNLNREMTLADISNFLSPLIKGDDEVKIVTFLAAVSTFTPENQVNLIFSGPSSVGKTYLSLSVANLLPPHRKMIIANASPTAFLHDSSDFDPERKIFVVDLRQKLLIFLDMPHFELLKRLRPLLSHDESKLYFKITVNGKKGLISKNIEVLGFPTVFFSTTELRIDEQEATRSILLTPGTDLQKVQQGLELALFKSGKPSDFSETVLNHPYLTLLRERFKFLDGVSSKIISIEFDDEAYQYFHDRLVSLFSKLKPRHLRDVERIVSLIKSLALWNFNNRRFEGGRLYVSKTDIDQVIELWSKISAAQETGLPPFALAIFEKIIKPYLETHNNSGLTRGELSKMIFQQFNYSMSDFYLRRVLIPSLENAGLIIQKRHPDDKRKLLICLPDDMAFDIEQLKECIEPKKEIEVKTEGSEKSTDKNKLIEVIKSYQNKAPKDVIESEFDPQFLVGMKEEGFLIEYSDFYSLVVDYEP